MKMLKKACLVTLAAFTMLSACKKDDDNNTSPNTNNPNNPSGNNPPPANTFNVKMTDAPGDYRAMNMEIVSVEAYEQNKGWVMLDNQTRTVNVLSLTNGAETTLASNTNVDAGVYTKLKIKFGNQHKLSLKVLADLGSGLVLTDNTVDLEWDGSKEVEMVINEQVTAQAGAEVLVDFNVAQSVREETGKYIVKPAMSEIKDARTGARGKVEGSASAMVVLTDGTNTFSTYIDAQGNFLLRGMKSGVYKLIVKPTKSATNFEPAEKQVDSVIIAEGEIKQMGTIQL